MPVSISYPLEDVYIPLYSRIAVDTRRSVALDCRTGYSDIGYLWCASWPAIEDVLSCPPAMEDRGRLDVMRQMRKIESHGKTIRDGSVEYHMHLRKFTGHDDSKLICIREDIEDGSRHDFDIVYAGDVIVSYHIPGLGGATASAKAVPGEATRVLFDSIDSKQVRIAIKNEQGEGISGARVVVVTRRDIDPGAPRPSNLTAVVSSQASGQRIGVRRQYMTSNERGELDVRIIGKGPGEIYVSATKAGYIGAGVELWSGFGLPLRDAFTIVLERGRGEKALLTVNGRPLANCNMIGVTDLQPASILGHIEYSFFSSDADGMVCFEQLIVGHEYGIIAQTDEAAYGAIITWRPGSTIALEAR